MAAGKKVRCPKCQAAVPVPAAAADDGFEVVDDAPPAKPVKKKPVVAADDDDDRPRTKRPREERDEDEDRPRTKRPREERDEDEDEDRPRKKKRRREDDDEDEDEKKGVSMTRNIVMGVVLLILASVAGYIFYTKYQEPDDGIPKGDGIPKVIVPGADADRLRPAGRPEGGK